MMILQYLLDNTLAQSTHELYRRSIKLFNNFHDIFSSGKKAPYPISASKLSKFIAFLVARGYKLSCIQSILSGLSYIHVLYD